jgi:hypothetical protein
LNIAAIRRRKEAHEYRENSKKKLKVRDAAANLVPGGL